MSSRGYLGIALLFCTVLFAVTPRTSSAGVITGVTIKEVSSELVTVHFRRRGDHTVDGSGGVATNSYTGSHVSTPEDTMWLSDGDGTHNLPGNQPDPHITGCVGCANPDDGMLGHIVFDLGAVYDVSQFRVWNYNEGSNANTPKRGARGVRILVSETNTLTGLASPSGAGVSTLSSPTTFPIAPGLSSYAGDNYVAPFRARYVRFDILNNHGDTNRYVGLSEVRFDGTPVVPEPASLALAGLGLCGFVASARRRQHERAQR